MKGSENVSSQIYRETRMKCEMKRSGGSENVSSQICRESQVQWLEGGGLLRMAWNTFGLEFLKSDEFFLQLEKCYKWPQANGHHQWPDKSLRWDGATKNRRSMFSIGFSDLLVFKPQQNYLQQKLTAVSYVAQNSLSLICQVSFFFPNDEENDFLAARFCQASRCFCNDGSVLCLFKRQDRTFVWNKHVTNFTLGSTEKMF